MSIALRHGAVAALFRLMTITALLGGTAAPIAHAQSDSAPVSGGAISIGMSGAAACLDPLKAAGGGVLDPTIPLFDHLIAVSATGKYEPDLATKWKFSHGGRWLTVTIRGGMRFSNGDALDAQAIKAEFDYLLASSSALGPLKRVQALTRSRLRFSYSSPFGPALDTLAAWPIADLAADQAMGQRSCDTPVGSGPFQVQSVSAGSYSVQEIRNPLHTWGPPWTHNHGPAYLSSLFFSSYAGPSGPAAALLSGGVDLGLVPPAVVPDLRSNGSITLHQSVEPVEFFLGFNQSRAPFDKPAVRRAVAMAIDRKALVRGLFNGFARVADTPVPPSDPYHDRQASTYAMRYKPSAARKNLTTRHITGPFTLETYNIALYQAIAQTIQQDLAKVGLQVNVVNKPAGEAQADIAGGQADLFLDTGDGHDYLSSAFLSSRLPGRGGRNWSFVRDRALDRLILKAQGTVNQGKQRAALAAVQRYMTTRVTMEPLFSRVLIMAARTRVQGYHSPIANLSGYPVFQDLYVTS